MAEATIRSQPRGKVLLIIIALLMFVVIVAAVLNYLWGSSRLDRRLADLRSRGLPTNGEELNAWYAVPSDVKDTTAQWTAATRAIAKANMISRAQDIPFVGLGPQPVPPPGEEWAKLEASRSFLKELDHELKLIMVAADAGGMARYPVDFKDGVNVLPIDQQETRNLARLLSLSAHVHAHDGKSQDVLKDVKAVFAVADSLDREPTIMSQIIRHAVHAMGCVLAVHMLPHCQWSDKDLKELQVAIAHAGFRKNLQCAFYGELALMLDTFKTAPRVSVFGVFIFPYSGRSMAIELIDAPARAMDLSWAETVESYDPASDEKMVMAGGTLLPALPVGIASGIRTEARQNCCIAAIAAHRYRLKHGALPRTLADLKDFLPNEDQSKSSRLIDPFDGQPLRFKTSANGVVIYNIGDNRVDDGGDVDNARRVSGDLGFLVSE